MPSSPLAFARTIGRARHIPSPWAKFLAEFIRHPGMIGSAVPSSRQLIDRMLAPIDWATVETFVEYGPGVGPFCRPILDRLSRDATYIAIDTNPDFVDYLRRAVIDPRFHAVHGSAADVASILASHGRETADYVLSGIPFSTLPAGVGERIVEETHRAVRPGGAFLAYQTSSRVLRLLSPVFPRIDSAMAWWNVPPARLYWAWKDSRE
jgi:phospholipid N-methyltransferase